MLLLTSVTITVKPLVATATGESARGMATSSSSSSGLGQVEVLSPGAERVTGKLLELALEVGIKVSNIRTCACWFMTRNVNYIRTYVDADFNGLLAGFEQW